MTRWIMRPWDWVVLGILAVLIVLALTGCSNIQVVPTALPLPEAPEIVFKSCPPDVCLSESDANKLDRYFQALETFRATWQRLQAEP